MAPAHIQPFTIGVLDVRPRLAVECRHCSRIQLLVCARLASRCPMQCQRLATYDSGRAPGINCCRTSGLASTQITNAAMSIGYALAAAAFDVPCSSRLSATRLCLPTSENVSLPSACNCCALGPAAISDVHFWKLLPSAHCGNVSQIAFVTVADNAIRHIKALLHSNKCCSRVLTSNPSHCGVLPCDAN